MKVRACWSALENKAERRINQLREDSARAEQLRQSLLGSQAKLEQMYEEYRSKAAAADQSHGMSDAMNQRQFMTQLLTLMQRVKVDMGHTENLLASIKERLIAAERDRIKMQTLADQNARAVRSVFNKREQRQMDALGVMQFNLRPQT